MKIAHLVGVTFETTAGVTFTIVNLEGYPESKVGKQYKGILAIKPNYLAAIIYRNTLIPNITLEQGVARITEVAIGGVVFNRPGAISKALGITEPMMPIAVNKVLVAS